jgi:hypothetical protein
MTSPPPEGSTVPTGAILAALSVLEATGQGDEVAAGRAGEIAGLVDSWGVPVLIQAFGLLIFGAMSAIRPTTGDNLHLTVPAVLARLGKIESARPFLPTMAGVLTAAATGDNVWQWRRTLGPVGRSEMAAWCWTAWLLADLLDTGRGEPGRFVRESVRIVVAQSTGETE